MESTREQQIRIRNPLLGFGFLYGFLLHLSEPGFNAALSALFSEKEWATRSLVIGFLWSTLAYMTLTLLRSLVEGVIEYVAVGSDRKNEELMTFVEHRFAAGCLLAFSFSWVASDILQGATLQAAHSLILLKLAVAGWCLSTPKNLLSCAVVDETTQQSSNEETGLYDALI